MPYTVFKVMVPFYRADRQAVRMQVDLIFIEAVPYAVMEWANTFESITPHIMARLDHLHLAKDVSGVSDYNYSRVIDQPPYWQTKTAPQSSTPVRDVDFGGASLQMIREFLKPVSKGAA